MNPSVNVCEQHVNFSNKLSSLLDELLILLEAEKEAVISVNEAKMLEIAEKKLVLINQIKELKKTKENLKNEEREINFEVKGKVALAEQKLKYNRKLLFTLYNTMGGLFEKLNELKEDSGTYTVSGRKNDNSNGGFLKKTWG